MSDSNRVGTVAATVQAGFFLLVPLVFAIILPQLGLDVTEQSDPVALLAFSSKNSLLMWFDAAIATSGVAIVALALVLHDQLRDAAPLAMRTSLVAATVGAIFFIASGITDLYDLASLRQVYITNPVMATTAYSGVGTMALSLLLPGWAAYGISVALTSRVAMKARRFAPLLNYLGILWGSLAVLSVFVFASDALYVVGLVVPVLGLIWASWLAWSLVQRDARHRTPAGQASQRPVGLTP